MTIQVQRIAVDDSTQFSPLNNQTGGVFTVKNLGPAVVYVGPVTAGNTSSLVDFAGGSGYPLESGEAVQVPDSSTSGTDTTVTGWNTAPGDETPAHAAQIILIGIVGSDT